MLSRVSSRLLPVGSNHRRSSTSRDSTSEMSIETDVVVVFSCSELTNPMRDNSCHSSMVSSGKPSGVRRVDGDQKARIAFDQ